MTAPQTRADGNARGLVVLVVAVVVGLLLLSNVGVDGSSSSSSGDDTAATTPPELDVEEDQTTTTPTTTTPAGRPAAEVTVIVLNGTDKDGIAGAKTTELDGEGYTMLEAGDSPVSLETTTVYYDVGFQPEGIALGQVLGVSTDFVLPLADAGLGGAESTANLVVVLGADTPPVD